ncbi:MAG: hypothetical protein AAF688_01450 [Bacteroidota bacterium]
MKNLMNIKRLALITITFILCAYLGISQSKVLQITTNDAKNSWIKYPPGTKFELKDKTSTIVFSDKDDVGTFKIDGEHVLTVNSTYNNEPEIFKINSGKVELVEVTHNKSNYGYFDYDEEVFTNGLSMSKNLERSEKNKNEYNAEFVFSNGITAKYTDGNMSAYLNGNPLKIEGNYLIYSELGLIKLSYDPRSNETWWVFEPTK